MFEETKPMLRPSILLKRDRGSFFMRTLQPNLIHILGSPPYSGHDPSLMIANATFYTLRIS
jgi:hypothetical protein